MTIIGTDASFKAGGPQPTLEEERQVMPAVVTAKELLGLVPDSLLYLAIHTKEESRSGHFKSDASHPTLAHFGSMRMGAPGLEVSDERWRGQYASLLGRLSPETRQRLMRSPEEMDSDWVALAHVVRFAAQVMAWLEADKVSPSAAEEEALYRQFPYLALKEVTERGDEIAACAEKILGEVGGNNAHSDRWREALSRYREGVYTSASHGAALLSAHMAAVELVLDAFKPPMEASSAMALAFSLAALICCRGGEGDPYGGQLLGLFSAFAGEESASRRGFAVVCACALALSVRAVYRGGLGPAPQGLSAEEMEGMRAFELELAAEVAIESGFIEAITGVVEEASLGGRWLSLGALLWTAALAGDVAAFLQEVAPERLTALLGRAAEVESERAAKGGREAAAWAVHVNQAHLSAERGDFEGCREGLWSAIPLSGCSRDEYARGVAAVRGSMESLLFALSSGLKAMRGGDTEVALSA